jgi:hypothetical protein
MLSDEQIRQIRKHIRNQTDEEFDEIWNQMVRDGIIDQDGNVLKKIPKPPDWLTQRNGDPKSIKSAKKKSRKRS